MSEASRVSAIALIRLQERIEVEKANRLAKLTGACEICFKPHDTKAPSCNRTGCVLRWQVREGKPSTPPQEAK